MTLFLMACSSASIELQKPAAGTLRVATYNVHYIEINKPTGAWSLADWERRKRPLDQAFKAVDADIVAFQEMESFAGGEDGSTNLTLDWLLERNSNYAVAAAGDWREFPSTQPILYRPDRLRLIDQGWFFFSDTPETLYSPTFNGSYPAFSSWAEFEEISTGKILRIYNVHFEFKSFSNRRLSSMLVAQRIAPSIEQGLSVLLVGDLNAFHGSKPIRILEDVGLQFLNVQGSTWHVNRGWNLFGAIDHMAFSNGLKQAGEPIVVRKQYDGEWPSDHYPVVGDFYLDH